MNRRSVLGGIAAGLVGLLSRPAKAVQQTTPLYVFEPQVITRPAFAPMEASELLLAASGQHKLTLKSPVYSQNFVFSTRDPHRAMLAVWMMIASANADPFNVERGIVYTDCGYSTWKDPPDQPPIGLFLGQEGEFVFSQKSGCMSQPDVMPEDIEQHSPFRKEWLLSPKLFRYDFTDPYGRW